jgi:hypothetical protein
MGGSATRWRRRCGGRAGSVRLARADVPRWILGCHAKDQLLDRCCGRGTSGMATCGVVLFPRDQSAVPGHDGGRSDREYLGPAATWHESGKGSQPHPVDGPVVHPSDLSAQHGVLMPQHQQLGILAQVSPHQHGAETQQTAHEPVQDRQRSIRRSSMTGQHTRSAGQDAASSFRAPHAGTGHAVVADVGGVMPIGDQ